MKTIIAGSRSVEDSGIVAEVMARAASHGIVPTEIVSGAAWGVDTLGEAWAEAKGLPVKRFPAEWDRLGKSAGYRRNEAMATYADTCVIIWDGVSKGSKHMASYAKAQGLKVFLVRVRVG
jgi:predicted Rossmann fold nucleotide-binding protein DprA/Smf involved in DNA uptake